MTGGMIALGDGVLLGTSAALGWTVVMVLAVVIGAVGTLKVVMATPPPRAAARPATVTLGLPLRETVEAVEPAAPEPVAETAPRPVTVTSPEVAAAPVAA
ncbi:hypothetical protein ACNHYB_09555 [Isoptericola jiangsuensis]|uniref:hypothetical protein n=1 Tax=Isoptericola jiangsuensis TaxID=548579 RepID=UPI003AAE2095